MVYLSEFIKVILKENNIDLKTRHRIVKEFDLEILRAGLTPDTLFMFYYLLYISNGDIDGVKKRIDKRALLQPNYTLEVNNLSEEQIHTIIFSVLGFIQKLGYDSQFNAHLCEWNNKKVEESKPLISFFYQ